MRRLAFVLALLALGALPSRSNLHPLADFTGAGAAVQLSTNANIKAKWIQVIADPGNSAAIRFGDATTSATVGLSIAKGAGYNTPTCGNCVYQLTAHYLYIANGDKVYVAWGD